LRYVVLAYDLICPVCRLAFFWLPAKGMLRCAHYHLALANIVSHGDNRHVNKNREEKPSPFLRRGPSGSNTQYCSLPGALVSAAFSRSRRKVRETIAALSAEDWGLSSIELLSSGRTLRGSEVHTGERPA
jgi:hypothetical protein